MMWKVSLTLVSALWLSAGICSADGNSTIVVSSNNSSLSSQNAKTTTNTTTLAAPIKIIEAKSEPVIDPSADKGTAGNPFHNTDLTKISEETSIGSFKYYFIILLVSSLSVISIIIFKTLRLRKSRAELKYGKSSASNRCEIEPLGKSGGNKWLDESSDENEEEIFDINFLKNSRTNKV